MKSILEIMKKILALVTLSLISLGAMASEKKITVSLHGDSRFEFEKKYYSKVLHIAKNPTCLELRSTHFVSTLSAKEKTSKLNVSPTEISFEKDLGGFCNYEFANTVLGISFDKTYSTGLTIFSRPDAQSEVDLACSIKEIYSKKYLKCREKGEAETNSDTRIYLDLSSDEAKINIYLE